MSLCKTLPLFIIKQIYHFSLYLVKYPQAPTDLEALPDAEAGEFGAAIDGLLQSLSDLGLPNIWIPSSDSFLEVEEIPLLGTGKMDLKAVQQVATDNFTEGE